MSTFSLGLGTSLPEGSYGKVAAGFSFNRYSASAFMNVDARPDALIILSRSTEYYFNDPNDPNLQPGETNRFDIVLVELGDDTARALFAVERGIPRQGAR